MQKTQRCLAVVCGGTLLFAACACRPAASAAGGPAVLYRAVERARSDPAAQLSHAFSVAVDRRGTVFVGDLEAIRVFGPDGRLLRSIGRQGGGPGEFQSVTTVELMPGDSVSAFDFGAGRVTVFEPVTYRPAYTVQVGTAQLFPPKDVHRVQRGRSLVALFQAAYSELDGRTRDRRRLQVLRLLNADGSLVKDSVLAVREPEFLLVHNPEAVAVNPFGRETKVAFTGHDRIVTAWSDSLRFDLYTLSGRHLKTIRASYVPARRPILARERDSLIAWMTNELVPAASVRRALDEHGATTWPLVQGMIVDDRERIWAGVTGARGEPNHWIAFDQDGARVAQVDLAPNLRLQVVRGTTAWAVATDENDVPQVVTLDLQPTQSLAMQP